MARTAKREAKVLQKSAANLLDQSRKTLERAESATDLLEKYELILKAEMEAEQARQLSATAESAVRGR